MALFNDSGCLSIWNVIPANPDAVLSLPARTRSVELAYSSWIGIVTPSLLLMMCERKSGWSRLAAMRRSTLEQLRLKTLSWRAFMDLGIMSLTSLSRGASCLLMSSQSISSGWSAPRMCNHT